MKKYLLSENGNYYKANLHCHSTVSDGRFTVEELKKLYMEHGYSIIAYTDHDVMIPHHDLTDENFLALTGYEMEVNDPNVTWPNTHKTCHMCLIAKDPDKEEQVCWHRSEYLFGNSIRNRDKVKFDESKPDFVREFTHEKINEMFRTGKENGFFVTYNHPCWSREDYRDYSGYKGMDAMEMINYGCVCVGYNDHNERVYDDMLSLHKKIFCIATDDNHDAHPIDSIHFDSCGGWTMIKADKLEYRTITKSLEEGNFYCSEGPEFHDLWIEDDVVHMTTSPVIEIRAIYGSRAGWTCENGGKLITEGSFSVNQNHGWVRFEAVDEKGKKAYTNAYFTEDILD